MINRENLVKIGRAGGKTSNRETPDQIGRVGISAWVLHCQELNKLQQKTVYPINRQKVAWCSRFKVICVPHTKGIKTSQALVLLNKETGISEHEVNSSELQTSPDISNWTLKSARLYRGRGMSRPQSEAEILMRMTNTVWTPIKCPKL